MPPLKNHDLVDNDNAPNLNLLIQDRSNYLTKLTNFTTQLQVEEHAISLYAILSEAHASHSWTFPSAQGYGGDLCTLNNSFSSHKTEFQALL